jgi:hypothetical protein
MVSRVTESPETGRNGLSKPWPKWPTPDLPYRRGGYATDRLRAAQLHKIIHFDKTQDYLKREAPIKSLSGVNFSQPLASLINLHVPFALRVEPRTASCPSRASIPGAAVNSVTVYSSAAVRPRGRAYRAASLPGQPRSLACTRPQVPALTPRP